MSLFNRPAWAKQQLSDDEDEGTQSNIFSHSHSYQDIVAEQEKRKKEKADRKKSKAERSTSDKREIKEELNLESTPKRRRITNEESEKLLKSVGLPARLDESDGEQPPVERTPVRKSPRKNNSGSTHTTKAPPSTAVIDLGGSSDEEIHDEFLTGAEASRAQPSVPVEEIQDESEDEFAELARKARQQRQQSNNRSSHKVNADSASPGVDSSGQTNHDRPPDPTIELLINSPLPNTNPLIVHRKLSQPTGAVRQAWCQKQGFTKEYTEGVFFVHRMRRVYDVTTCRSLGLDVDALGNVTMKGADGKEGVHKVLLQAVTEEAFQQMKEQKDKEAQTGHGEQVADDHGEHAAAPEKEEKLVRVILKAKGQSDFKLKVKPVRLSVSSPVRVTR